MDPYHFRNLVFLMKAEEAVNQKNQFESLFFHSQ
jgi:hypothetical protein